MKEFAWAGACIVGIVAFLLLNLLAKIDVGDVVYAMLSGSVVGFVTSALGAARGVPPDRAIFMLAASIAGSAVSWVFATLALKVATLSLYSTTALAFDLVVGMLGAAPLAYHLLAPYVASEAR